MSSLSVNERGNYLVTNQSEFDAAVAADDRTIELVGDIRIVARGFVQLIAFGLVEVSASEKVVVTHDGKGKVEGGLQILFEPPATPAEWCEYYGVKVKDGIATVFKGVRENFVSSRGTSYEPGSQPVADDWDGGFRECGLGLHFSPHPRMTHEFDCEISRYLACPVALADMAVHPKGGSPHKCKAKGLCAPCWEVDDDGEPVDGGAK